MNSEKMFKIHKFIIAITAVLNLGLTSVHIDALGSTDVPISGFFMFMFILIGMLCLFNVTRIEKNKISSIIISSVAIVITMSFGITLVALYFKGVSLGLERGIDLTSIYMGIGVSIVILVAYLTGLVFMALSMFKKKVN